MRLTIELSDGDRELPTADLLIKAQRGAHQALAKMRPDVEADHAHAATHRGGEVQALGDLTEEVAAMYQRRVDRMLEDISTFLLKGGRRG